MAHLSRDVQRLATRSGSVMDNIVKGSEKVLGTIAAARGVYTLARGAYTAFSSAAPLAATLAPLAAAL